MSEPTRRPLVSIISPVYNEEDAVEPFYQRLLAVLERHAAEYDFEILFSNNRSTDQTADRVLALRQRDPRVQLLTLSRNYGYQNSMVAGLRQASGEAVILIDVDCEDPPEMITTFLEGWREGYDVVFGVRDRRQEALWITWLRKIFYRVNKLIADSDIIVDMAEFCLMTAVVRDAVLSAMSTYPFLRAEIAHYGFHRKGIRYNRQKRMTGQSHFNLYGMTRFAIAGILSSTTVPLRLSLYLLPVLFVVNALLLGLEIAGIWPWGFETLVCLDLLYLSTALAFLALYQARNYRNVIARPLAVVDWRSSATNVPPQRSGNTLPTAGPAPTSPEC